MNEIYVSSASELMTALSSAKGGDVVLLESGNYGSIDLSNVKFNDYVTLRSADPDNKAVLQTIDFNNSSHIRIDGLVVDKGPQSSGRLVDIYNSDNIEVVNSEIVGDGPTSGTYGIYTKESSDITVTNNYVHDLDVGISTFSTKNVTVNENYVDYVHSDYYKFGGVQGALFENNTGGGHTYPNSDTHSDFLQFQGSASDVVIRGNLFLAQTTERPQGIFLADSTYNNILIEQNIIYSGKINAIVISDGSGIVVRDNTLLSTPFKGHKAAAIIVPDGATVQNNITTSYNGGFSGSNVVAQYDDPSDVNYYNDLFVNADKGLGVTLEDLRPIPGSVAETTGAYDRLMELLDGTPYVPEPSDPTPVDPTPAVPDANKGDGVDEGTNDNAEDSFDQGQIEFDQIEGAAFSMVGTKGFSNTADVVEVAHSSDLALDAGTVALSFNADTVSGTMGLVSKDASYYGGGGNHLVAYIQNGTLIVRFQDGSGDEIARIGGIKANTDYDLQISFGNGEVGVWLDGEQVHSADFEMSWESNVEHFQIGALGWASQSGQAGFRNAFDGEISDVVVVEGVWEPDQIQDLIQNAQPLPDENPVPQPDAPSEPETPVTEPETPVTEPETPVAEGDANTVFETAEVEFNGKKSSIVNLEHDSDLELEEGTIAFIFNADDLKGTQGLLSKDAKYYAGGGNHLSVMLKGDDLVLRFQDEDSDAYLTFEDLQANEDYEVQTWFGDGKIGLAVNGELVATKDFDFDLSGNQQNLQLGGLGWASSNGGDAVTQAFNGTMTEVAIYDEVLPIVDSGDMIL